MDSCSESIFPEVNFDLPTLLKEFIMSAFSTIHVFSYGLEKTSDDLERLTPKEVRFRFGYTLSGILRHEKRDMSGAAELLNIPEYKLALILQGQGKFYKEDIKNLEWAEKLSKNFKKEWEKYGKEFKKYAAVFPSAPPKPHKPGLKTKAPKNKLG
jgi:hypothetical protein